MVQVFISSLELASALVDAPLASLAPRAETERELRPLLEQWREKLQDSNVRGT